MAQDGTESPPETLEKPYQSSTSPVDSPTADSADPSLSRTGSFSKLNARAPEFVPSTTARPQQPPPAPPPARLSVIPPPAAAMMHMYPPANSPPPPAVTPPSPYHVQIHSPVPVAHVIPVQNHHHRPHHHNQLQQPPQQYVPVRNHNNHHHHHHFAQNAHYIPVEAHANQNHHYGPVSKKLPQQSEEGEQSEIPDHGRSKNERTDRSGFSDDNMQKLVNQVEYYFSDLNLATTDHLMRFINKDRDGYVPINVVASFKKVKAAVNNNVQLANILKNSSKLAVSEDGKKVKRQQPFTEQDVEDLQSRIIVAENLPEDHCHQNLMKIFSSVGSVKTIRTCPPQNPAGASSASRSTKAEGMYFINKLHAFVEYDSVEIAEKAVMELNDEANWRNGLRVRLMLKRPSKTVRGKKGNDGPEEEEVSTSEQQPNEKHVEDISMQQHDVHFNDPSPHVQEEDNHNEKEGVQRKGRGRGGRGKGRSRGHSHHNSGRGNHTVGNPSSGNATAGTSEQQPNTLKQAPPPGPRMPDGTRGFAMGRGKPISVIAA